MNILTIKIRKYFPILLITAFSLQAQAVQAQRGMRRQAIRNEAIQRLEEAKWGFIIYRLNLSEEKSNRLLPIFKNYEAEKRDIILSRMHPFKENRDSMDDEQAEAFMNSRLENAQKLLDLKEKYKTQFLAVLSPKELLALQNAEQDFAMKVAVERQKRRANRDR
jgi:hypothetical protein